ncbi:unnamed protein product [Adineta ricciae]|uniref:Uncharacterized protein n=1 Tax=Adineta ricciae TaxID=249248 RepID=A0A815VI69_ADIRI|nr:unnamed protein product [Adineta ricciae]CAF1600498.1 unnamed protein product [Adineta ricciae]
MWNSQLPYVNRSTLQQQKRQRKINALLQVLNKVNSDEKDAGDSSNIDEEDEPSKGSPNKSTTLEDDFSHGDDFDLNTTTYKPDENDAFSYDSTDFTNDSSSPLYEHSYISVKYAAMSILSIATEIELFKVDGRSYSKGD